jgi:hypothetical protein
VLRRRATTLTRPAVAVVAVVLALLITAVPAAATPRHLFWGAWIGSQLTGEEPPWDMSAARRFEKNVHKGLSLLQFSAPFTHCSPKGRCGYYTFPTDEMTKIRNHGAIPFFSWNSGSSGGEDSDSQLSDVISGRYDRYIRIFATQARDWGHPFFLRYDWEMNGDWYPWGAGTNGNKPGEFVAAWRHVHKIFTEEGATNATWVWCPYAHDESLRPFYPGGQYVDWTCLDGFNWGPDAAAEPAPWRSFPAIFGDTYRRIIKHVAPDKPMVIAEVASTGTGTEKALWIRKMFGSLRSDFKRVHGLIWLDKVDRGVEWPIETSPVVTRAFRKGIQRGFKANVFSKIHLSPIQPPG